MDYKDIIKKDLGAEELKELTMEDLEDVAGGGAWHDVHAYIDEMNRKYGGNAREEDLSPEERRHLKHLRDKGYEEWRRRLR